MIIGGNLVPSVATDNNNEILSFSALEVTISTSLTPFLSNVLINGAS